MNGQRPIKPAMLPQSVAKLADSIRVGRVLAAIALMAVGMVAAFGLAPETTLETVPTERIVRELALPGLAASGTEERFWREERVRRGDTLGAVLARLGADDAPAQRFLHTDPRARALYQLRPGKALRVETDPDARLLALRYLLPTGEQLAVDRMGEGFAAQTLASAVTVGLELRATEIRSSLFAAADTVGLPDAITMQLADVFSGDIDFHHDLRRGDRFAVLYEMRYVDGEPLGAGRIAAAEFVNKGVRYRAFLWRAPDGSEGYYAEDGKTLRKAFLRSPLAFTRVTSGFSLARFHPFLQTWRAHKGVDFAAPIGTQVRAAGDGTVALAGRQTGYGNVVVLQHAGAYSTLYAHLSRFAPGLKPGARVQQGDVIGYVGETGWATGPHLHYEFRVNNAQRNPLTVALPNAQPLPAEQRSGYLEQAAVLAAQLALSREMVLAGGE
jgi:murein DD-endopeptidase MepM/ murein hydrolase activator NlpD